MKRSIRQYRQLKQQASDALTDLYFAIDKIDPAMTEVEGEARKEGLLQFAPVSKSVRRLTAAILKILTAVSRDERPRTQAIRQLEIALNRKIRQIRYDPDARKRNVWERRATGQRVTDPANPWQVELDPLRETAEIAIRYLRLCAAVGPVHIACKQCGKIVLSGRRRTKEYCSDRCRAAFWNYDRIKQTYWSTPANQRKRELGRTKTETKRPAQVTQSPKLA